MTAERAAPSTGTAFAFGGLHHVRLAIPKGGEGLCRQFWGDVLA
ncbi:hypothetical protein [Streptomyces sp. NPDC002889]